MSEERNPNFHNLDEQPVIKEARDVTRHLMTAQQAKAFQAGDIESDYRPPRNRVVDDPAGTPPAPPPQPPQVPPQQPPPQPPSQQTAQPQQVPPQHSGQAVPTDHTPPTYPGDSERAQKRINRLFGQKRQAEETAEAYASRIQQLENQIEQLTRSPQLPGENPNYNFGATPQPQADPAGQYITRDDFARFVGEMKRSFSETQRLATSQRASRTEAESEFAQDFADPSFRQTYEQVLAGSFAGDPDGPYKAALMTRGALADARTAAPVSPGADAARRQALSGIGPSVPEGGSAPQSDQVTRYNEALATAKRTGRDQDFARALLIKNGQL